MAVEKYGHLIKPLAIGETSPRQVVLNGREHLEGMNLTLSWSVHTATGDMRVGKDMPSHSYPECLLFVGLDTANATYLGAEIECSLGPEHETYVFNEPTAIIIPAGLPHGPFITRRMYSPKGFGLWSVQLGIQRAEDKAAPAGANGRYAHLVKSLKSGLFIQHGRPRTGVEPGQAGRPGPGNPDHLVWMSGKDLEGLDLSVFWGFCSSPGIWHRGAGAHVHPSDEVLVYVGMDPGDPGSLGAEIEIDLGAEHERHLINAPSAVVCPAGVPHLPQVTRWVDRPFGFFAVCLAAEHATKAFD
ncbi:MAG: hypothetical protein GXX84_19165 [Acidobacteria bacterium]|nr:hypothetical protein [Acidobacteriota bacterium]